VNGTCKFLSLASVFDLDVRLAISAEEPEWEVLQIGLHLSISELLADRTPGIENARGIKYQSKSESLTDAWGYSRIIRVRGDLILGGIAKPLIFGEGHIGWCCAVTLVVMVGGPRGCRNGDGTPSSKNEYAVMCVKPSGISTVVFTEVF